jgi:small-conductance mechanosensitive channel
MQSLPVTNFALPFFTEPLITSVFLLVTLLTARMFLVRAVRNKSEILSRDQRRWISQIKNGILLLVVIGLILIWAPQLRTLALSLAAVAVALVVATKEMILCLSGAFMRVSTRPFVVGDWITIDNMSGEVIDVNAFTIKLQKLDVVGKSYQLTGPTVEIPNSRLLTSAVENLTLGKSWIYHDVRMVVPALDARPIEHMAILQEIITRRYADLQEQSEIQHARLKRKSGIDLPGIKPDCSLSTTDLGHHVFTAHLFIPTRNAGQFTQQISFEFLSAVQRLKEQKAAEALNAASRNEDKE